jgi:2-amino-4-hydroxy-6-hydroxymethyldihydropteridine diphosphokinase
MTDKADEVAAVRRVTYVGAAVNVGIAGVKFVGGIAFSSQALLADAIHSLTDLVTDFALVLGVKFWVSPADDDHPYGHGKIESVVTAFIGVMVAGAALEICWKGIGSLLRGEIAAPGSMAFLVALLSVVAKEALYRWTHAVARRLKSPATEANAWHHRSDALSSIPVAVAVAVAHFYPSLKWLDAAGAILVGAFVLRVAWQIVKPAFMDLTDARCDGAAADVERIALAVPGVRRVHKVRIRRYGGTYQCDLHVQVARDLTISQGHSIGHEVKAAVLEADIGMTDAVIHVEPEDARVILCLGSNIEPRLRNLDRAQEMLCALPSTHFAAASGTEETEPVDVPPEFAAQKFLNRILVVETALSPNELSERMHAIEGELGRVRGDVRNAPRTIDIDMIDYEGVVSADPALTLPHPRARGRAFVMEPLRRLGIGRLADGEI